MKILCWNMGSAFGRWRDEPELHERAWHWVAAVDADIAFLQEIRIPSWARDRWRVVIGPYQFFASAVLSRPSIPIATPAASPSPVLDGFGSYLATGELALSDGSQLVVASVHTSAREAPHWGHPGLDRSVTARTSVGRPWWNDVAFAAYRELVAGRRFLLAGDWNTSRFRDEHEVANAAGAEFFDRAASAGWIDISLDADGREVRTWYGFETQYPHQADHAFADSETAALVQSFVVDPWPVEALDLSDHAPLLFEIGLEAVAASCFAAARDAEVRRG